MTSGSPLDAPWSGVMHVFSSLARGGAERRTIEVVNSTRYKFAFLAASGRSGSLDAQVTAAGHDVFHLKVLSAPSIFAAAKVMRRQRIRVLHSHLGVASALVLISGLLAGVKIRVVHCRSDAIGGRRTFFKSTYLALSRIIVRALATDIVAVSPTALSRSGLVRGQWRGRARVVPNGLDSQALYQRANVQREARGEAEERIVVISVARAEQSKNRKRAIDIWAELAHSTTTTLKLVGAMSREEQQHATGVAAAFAGTGSDIELLGEVDDVPEQLGRSDVLLVTSLREGLPGVVLEALACGTTVVASDLPGTRWIASQTEGVQVVDLSEPDAVWAKHIATSPLPEYDVAASFARSEFQLSRSVQEHLGLWRLGR